MFSNFRHFLLISFIFTVNSKSSFIFEIKCSASPLVCSRMTATLKSAGTRLSKILTIKVPILVSVNLESFGSSLTSVLGLAAPTSFGFGRIDQSRPFSSFPQALLKQINPATLYTGPDISARFNSDFNFYFKSSGQPITSDQYDFEYVACHEITHGLGFIDDFKSTFSDNPNPTFLIPSFYVDSATGTLFEGWVLPNTFNTLMYDSNKKKQMFSYYKSITQGYTNNGAEVSLLDTQFQKSKIAYGASKSNFLASESTKLIIHSNFNSTPIILYSPGVFLEGSSISHTDYTTYRKSPDFLMLYTIADC